MTDLPPTQYLVMEVLAARYRTGEPFWTFPSSLRRTLDALLRAGLVDVLSSPAPACLRVQLTEAGRKHSLKPDYVPPVIRELRNSQHWAVASTGGRRCERCEGEISRGQAYAIQPGTGGLVEHVHCPDGAQ